MCGRKEYFPAQFISLSPLTMTSLPRDIGTWNHKLFPLTKTKEHFLLSLKVHIFSLQAGAVSWCEEEAAVTPAAEPLPSLPRPLLRVEPEGDQGPLPLPHEGPAVTQSGREEVTHLQTEEHLVQPGLGPGGGGGETGDLWPPE